MANLKKAAIIGASAASCIYALFLKSKNYDVTIFEGSNNIGGAWGEDEFGSKYSNIIGWTLTYLLFAKGVEKNPRF